MRGPLLFLVALASAPFLTVSLQRSLGVLAGDAPGAGAAEYTIHAPLPGEKRPEATANEVWVKSIFADGVRQRPEMVRLTGSWEIVRDGDPILIHRGADPATVSFSSRTAVIVLGRSPAMGIARITRAGTELLRVDGHDPAWDAPDRILDLPAVAVPAWTWILCASLVGLVLAASRPWRAPRGPTTWLLAYLVILHACAWLGQCIGTTNDSPGYLDEFSDIARGKLTYFPPGYPLFVALGSGLAHLFRAPDRLGTAVTLLQHALMVGSLWWLFELLKRFAPLGLAFAAVLVTGSMTSTLFLPQTIQSENVAVFGIVGALYFALRDVEGGGRIAPRLSGFHGGFAALARVVPLAGLFPALAVLYAGGLGIRAGLRRAAAPLFCMSLWVAAPMGWFAVHGYGFTLSNGVELHLYNRVITAQNLTDPEGPATRRIRAVLRSDLKGIPWWHVMGEFDRMGVGVEEVRTLMGLAALEGIRKAPLEYLRHSFPQAWSDFVTDPCHLVPDSGASDASSRTLENPPLVRFSAAALAWRRSVDRFQQTAWPVSAWLAAAGLLAIPFLTARYVLVAIALAAAGFMVATAFVEFSLSRYNTAIMPLGMALATAPFAALARGLASARASARASRAQQAVAAADPDTPQAAPRSPASEDAEDSDAG